MTVPLTNFSGFFPLYSIPSSFYHKDVFFARAYILFLFFVQTIKKRCKETNAMTNTPKWEAIILAGGMGSRLAPITDRLPKPLVPVAGMPVMERVTGVLKKNGFDRAVLTVCAPQR